MSKILNEILIGLLQLITCILWIAPFLFALIIYLIHKKYEELNENTSSSNNKLIKCLVNEIKGSIHNEHKSSSNECIELIKNEFSLDMDMSGFTETLQKSINIKNIIASAKSKTYGLLNVMKKSLFGMFDTIKSIGSGIIYIIKKIFDAIFNFFEMFFSFCYLLFNVLVGIFLLFFSMYSLVISFVRKTRDGMGKFGKILLATAWIIPLNGVVGGIMLFLKGFLGGIFTFMLSLHSAIKKNLDEISIIKR